MLHRKIIAAMAISVVTAVAVPYAVSAASASAPGQRRSVGIESSDTCAHTITRGSGATLEKFCTTTNGNLIQLAWNGVEQIDEGYISEGYTLCVGGVVKAYDLADGGESGFQAPVTTEPGGANTLPLTISRKTTDNTLQFTQVYTDGLDSVTVTASLKNLTGATIHTVKYFRWNDIDASDTTGGNTWMRSPDAIVANDDGATGLLMGTATYGQARTVGVISISSYEYGGGWDTCSPTSDTTPITSADESAFAGYNLVNLQAGVTKTSTVVYRRV